MIHVISFRLLQISDFPMLLRWLNSTHVKQWWDSDVQWTFESVALKYTAYVAGAIWVGDLAKPIHAFIIENDGVPIGYLQHYLAHDFWQTKNSQHMRQNTGALDYYIGETAFLGKGLGSKILEKFIQTMGERYYDAIAVDPDPKNLKAIKRYCHAGFHSMSNQLDLYIYLCKKEFRCPGCLGVFKRPQNQQCTHPYIGASADCWELYGKILAKEYQDPAYFMVHRITVDAYCAQHIGNQSDRRARQSAWVHLIALYLLYENNLSEKGVLEQIRYLTHHKREWSSQMQRDYPLWQTVQDVADASSPENHAQRVKSWGKSVLDDYQDCLPELEKLY